MAISKSKKISKENLELDYLKKKVELLEKQVEQEEIEEGSGKGKKKEPTDEEIYNQSEVLYSWTAPIRVYEEKSRNWYLIVAMVVLLLIFLFVLLDKPLFIAVTLSSVFLLYVVSTTKPEDLTHEITNKGIYTLKKMYRWDIMKDYWFVEIQGQRVLYVDTKIAHIPRLIMLVGEGSTQKINNILQKYIPYNYIEKQSSFVRWLDGIYMRAEDVPGVTPSTNKRDQ